MSEKILVTGAAGFIGSHLCDYFVKKKLFVTGIDNLLTGKIENINHLKSNKFFKFYEHDVCKPLDFDENYNYILHFASTASPVDYLKYPIQTLRIGSLGTENLLELAYKYNSTILVASTSEIYGDPLEHPQNEAYFGNVNPIGLRGVYDEAKRYLEALTMAYHRKRNLNSKIVRIFNTYGPRMRVDDGRAIPNFINQMINNKEITVFGNGNQTRSFAYIDDTVIGIYKCLVSDYNLPVNIGNSDEYSILELVNILKSKIKTRSKIVYSKLPKDDPKVRRPDISLAKKVLNWEPVINLDVGLETTIDYFRSQ